MNPTNQPNDSESMILSSRSCAPKKIEVKSKHNEFVASSDESSDEDEAWASIMLRQLGGSSHNVSMGPASNYEIRREITYMIRCLNDGKEKEEDKEKQPAEEPRLIQKRRFLPKTYDLNDPEFDMNEFLLDDSAHVFVPLSEASDVHKERYNDIAKKDESKN